MKVRRKKNKMRNEEYQEGDRFYAGGELKGIYTGKRDFKGRLILKDNVGEFPIGNERQYEVEKLENIK